MPLTLIDSQDQFNDDILRNLSFREKSIELDSKPNGNSIWSIIPSTQAFYAVRGSRSWHFPVPYFP
ncbi:Exonuclease I [Pseudomonas syringae pv. actinidiae]|uniref:Exonuclease I n=1 Tax=Pseudomonas syringae pv. actinidiae TaxID=103796 RepID=A0A2V0R5V8_PSESF|nr:Exonuclease I [Pseudomonas syringae pv. actinidiae]GBH16902.1 Exonuclease I [Pseudomonas syringae pv. actinidiae]